ncbi:hypothetical protein HDU77_009771 [Chytriomyces hyalinus]|nr:hypothetical protein HDU77_009771 [Chytriomyces hyalinus]
MAPAQAMTQAPRTRAHSDNTPRHEYPIPTTASEQQASSEDPTHGAMSVPVPVVAAQQQLAVSQFTCLWALQPSTPCLRSFTDPDSFYAHLAEEHVGRKSHGNLSLNCMWMGCAHGDRPFSKRDHIVSHCRAHVPFKANVCVDCNAQFKWPQDLKKHCLKQGHTFIEPASRAEKPGPSTVVIDQETGASLIREGPRLTGGTRKNAKSKSTVINSAQAATHEQQHFQVQSLQQQALLSQSQQSPLGSVKSSPSQAIGALLALSNQSAGSLQNNNAASYSQPQQQQQQIPISKPYFQQYQQPDAQLSHQQQQQQHLQVPQQQQSQFGQYYMQSTQTQQLHPSQLTHHQYLQQPTQHSNMPGQQIQPPLHFYQQQPLQSQIMFQMPLDHRSQQRPSVPQSPNVNNYAIRNGHTINMQSLINSNPNTPMPPQNFNFMSTPSFLNSSSAAPPPSFNPPPTTFKTTPLHQNKAVDSSSFHFSDASQNGDKSGKQNPIRAGQHVNSDQTNSNNQQQVGSSAALLMAATMSPNVMAPASSSAGSINAPQNVRMHPYRRSTLGNNGSISASAVMSPLPAQTPIQMHVMGSEMDNSRPVVAASPFIGHSTGVGFVAGPQQGFMKDAPPELFERMRQVAATPTTQAAQQQQQQNQPAHVRTMIESLMRPSPMMQAVTRTVDTEADILAVDGLLGGGLHVDVGNVMNAYGKIGGDFYGGEFGEGGADDLF